MFLVSQILNYTRYSRASRCSVSVVKQTSDFNITENTLDVPPSPQVSSCSGISTTYIGSQSQSPADVNSDANSVSENRSECGSQYAKSSSPKNDFAMAVVPEGSENGSSSAANSSSDIPNNLLTSKFPTLSNYQTQNNLKIPKIETTSFSSENITDQVSNDIKDIKNLHTYKNDLSEQTYKSFIPAQWFSIPALQRKKSIELSVIKNKSTLASENISENKSAYIDIRKLSSRNSYDIKENETRQRQNRFKKISFKRNKKRSEDISILSTTTSIVKFKVTENEVEYQNS